MLQAFCLSPVDPSLLLTVDFDGNFTVKSILTDTDRFIADNAPKGVLLHFDTISYHGDTRTQTKRVTRHSEYASPVLARAVNKMILSVTSNIFAPCAEGNTEDVDCHRFLTRYFPCILQSHAHTAIDRKEASMIELDGGFYW